MRAARMTGVTAGLLCLALAAGLAGCASKPFAYSPDRVSAYIAAHPDLAGPVRDALRRGTLTNGMTRAEVALCLGEPTHVEKSEEHGQRREVWVYSRSTLGTGDLEVSTYWHQEVPIAKVYFGSDRLVQRWALYGVNRPPAKPAPAKASVAPKTAAPQPGAGVTESRAVLPEPPPGVFRNWPLLTLNGVACRADRNTAVVNGKMLQAGDAIEGVKILSIDPRGVQVDFKRDVEFLVVGGTTADTKQAP